MLTAYTEIDKSSQRGKGMGMEEINTEIRGDVLFIRGVFRKCEA